MPRCEVNGASLHYERHGSGEPLLLMTGFTISAAVFEPVLERYARRWECILYDHRGSGRTRAPARPTSMPGLAADAAGLLAALGIGSAHVYGVSMGGMVAQELALRFPERVRGLVLGGTTAGGPQAARPAAGELAALASAAAGGAKQGGGSWLAAALFSPAFRREHPERVRALLKYFARHPPSRAGALAQWWATVFHDTTSRLAELQAPTLVMHGGVDALSPLANSRLLAERIPDAELAVIPGAGHAYVLERPEEAYAALAGWLERRSPIAPGAARAGWNARAEPFTRALGLPVGMARTGGSLAGLAAERVAGRARRPR